MRPLAGGQVEPLREVEDVGRAAAAERDGGGEVHLPRQRKDAVGDDVVALRVGHLVARVGGSARIVEAEQVVAVLLGLGVRPGEVGAPPAGERPVEREVDAAVPVILAVRVGDDHVAVARHQRRAAEAGRRQPGEAVVAAHVVVAERADPRAERLPEAQVPLVRVGGLGVVVEEIDLGAGRSRCDEGVEAGAREVARIPPDRPRAPVGRELDPVDGILQTVAFVEGGVEEDAVVVAPGAAEDDGLAVAAQVIGEAEPRLERVLVGVALVAVREVARAHPAGERRGDGRRRHVARVELLGLVVPA